MQISKAQRTGSKTCGRCGGSGEYGMNEVTAREIYAQGGSVSGSAVCYRCGGTGSEATGFVGNDVTVTVRQSAARRGSAGGRRGTIDVIAVVTTFATPKPLGRSGVRAVTETIESVRIVGRMVDGTAFDKTVAGALSADLDRRMSAGLGASPLELDDAAAAAVLADLGIAAESAAA